MRCHSIRGHHPPSFSQLMRHGKLVVVMLVLGVQSKSNQRQAFPSAFAHDNEAELLERGSKVVSRTSEVVHDGAVPVLAKADHLVILADDLGGTFGEVEGEGSLIRTEIIDVEDELFGKEFWGAPDDPADTGIDLSGR